MFCVLTTVNLLGHSNHYSSHSTGQGTTVGILPTPERIYSIYEFLNWENYRSVGSGTHWSHWGATLS